jgi:hypothetical protein
MEDIDLEEGLVLQPVIPWYVYPLIYAGYFVSFAICMLLLTFIGLLVEKNIR